MTASQFFIQSPCLHCPPFKQIKQWRKKLGLPLEPKDCESQRSCSFRGNDNGFEVRWERLLCVCLRRFTHLCTCVCDLSGFPLFQTVCFHFVVHPHPFIYKQKPWQHVSPDMFSWLHLSPSKLDGVIFAFREKKRRKSEKTYMTVRLPAENVASVQWGQLCNHKQQSYCRWWDANDPL